jgi:hypothetical protein
MCGDVLRIYPDHAGAKAAPRGLRVAVVRCPRDADRLRGQRPCRVQVSVNGWGGNMGAVEYLLDSVLAPMVVDGARLEFVP